MDSSGKSIFFPVRVLLMESVQHAAVRGAASGGRTMKRRAPHETEEAGAARGRQGRFDREPASRRSGGAESVGSGFRCRDRPGDAACRKPRKAGGGSLPGGAGASASPGAHTVPVRPWVILVKHTLTPILGVRGPDSGTPGLRAITVVIERNIVNPLCGRATCRTRRGARSLTAGSRYVVVIQGFPVVWQDPCGPRRRDAGRLDPANYCAR